MIAQRIVNILLSCQLKNPIEHAALEKLPTAQKSDISNRFVAGAVYASDPKAPYDKPQDFIFTSCRKNIRKREQKPTIDSSVS